MQAWRLNFGDSHVPNLPSKGQPGIQMNAGARMPEVILIQALQILLRDRAAKGLVEVKALQHELLILLSKSLA